MCFLEKASLPAASTSTASTFDSKPRASCHTEPRRKGRGLPHHVQRGFGAGSLLSTADALAVTKVLAVEPDHLTSFTGKDVKNVESVEKSKYRSEHSVEWCRCDVGAAYGAGRAREAPAGAVSAALSVPKSVIHQSPLSALGGRPTTTA